MASPAIPSALRGLVLTAPDLRKLLPNVPDAFIEDYLSILENILTLTGIINQKQDILQTISVVDGSPYEISDLDEVVFFDTTAGDIIANLRPGTKGRHYRLINVGTGGNKVTVNPDGSEKIFGAASENIYDYESLELSFSDVEGWA